MASCTEEILGVGELPPLAGEVVLTDVVETSAIRLSPNYIFTLELKNASGVVLEAKLASASTALDAGTYTEASAAYATAGNFITGAEGTKLTVNGETHLVTAGTLKVGLEGGSYSLSGVVKVDNGNNYSIEWAGAPLTWGDVLVATQLNTVMHTQANQNKTLTVKLAGEGVEFTAGQWGPQITGGKGNYLSVDFYSEDGYLAPGSYAPAANPNAPKKGEYVPGYVYEQVWGDQVYASMYGSNWFTVDAAATPMESCEHLVKGNITVAVEGEVFTITVDNNEIYAQFVGEIPAILTPAVPADPWELTGNVVLVETEGISMTMTDDTANNTMADGSALSGVTLWFVELKNAAGNVVAWFDLVTKAGSQSLAGEYQVTSYPDAVGEAGNGFYIDLGAMGWGEGIMSGGTILYGPDGTAYITDADKTKIKITEDRGQTTIIVKGTSNGSSIAAKYVFGEIKEDEGGEGEGGACGCDCEGCQDCTGGSGDSTPAVQYTPLASFIHLQPGTGIVTVYLGEAGMKYENNGVTGSAGQSYFKFDVYSADGATLAPGVYTPNAKPGDTPAEGQFAQGWDPGDIYNIGWAFENWGSCYMTKGDSGETGVKITDGTITVEENGGNYVIKVESSAMNLKYEGPLK